MADACYVPTGDPEGAVARVPFVKPLAILPAAACMLLLAACGSTTVSRTSAPAATSSAAAQATAPSPSPSSDSTTGHLGDTFQITDSTDGWSYSATLVKVLDPAQPDDSFDAADSGKRLVGAEFKLTGISGNAQDDANNDASVQGSDGQVYSPSFSGLATGTNFDNGDFSLRPRSAEIGWVTFQVPDGVKVTEVQWDPSLSGSPATWVISS